MYRKFTKSLDDFRKAENFSAKHMAQLFENELADDNYLDLMILIILYYRGFLTKAIFHKFYKEELSEKTKQFLKCFA